MGKRMLKDERHEMVQAVADEAPHGMVIGRFVVENILRVKWAALEPQGPVVVVGGKNGQGKSSLLKAIGWLLRGVGDMDTNVIRVGQRTASIIGQVGPFKITRVFTRVPPEKSRKGNYYYTRIKVEGPRGEEFPSPQVLLNKLLGLLSFDPLQFLREKPAEQMEAVRGMAKFAIDIDALEKLQQVDYEARRQQRYEVDSLRNRLEAMPKPPDGDVPTEMLDVEELTRQLQGAAEHNSRVREMREIQETLRQRAANAEAVAAQFREDAAKALADAQNLDGKVYEIRMLPKLAVSKSQARELWDAAKAVEVGTEIDVEAIAAQLRAAQAMRDAMGGAKAYHALAAELEAAEAAWTAIDERMKARAEERMKAMREAEMPIKGLAIGDGQAIGDEELWFEGLPFSQASGAQQIRVALALGMAKNPKVRVLRFMDGGWDMLDEESQALVMQLVAERKFQLWAEHVGGGGNVTVTMKDGEASGRDVMAEVK